jgi:hypothetical protein
MDEHPDSSVIDKLDGSTAVARLCRVRPQAVSQWRRNGIPAARRDYLQLLRPDAFAGHVDTAAPKADEVRDAA